MTGGLWTKNAHTPEGKFGVFRRDGTMPEWPYFVLGARDPHAPAALRAYANAADGQADPQFVDDIRTLAGEFEWYRAQHDAGDPDAVPHRQDHPTIIAWMQQRGHAIRETLLAMAHLRTERDSLLGWLQRIRFLAYEGSIAKGPLADRVQGATLSRINEATMQALAGAPPPR